MPSLEDIWQQIGSVMLSRHRAVSFFATVDAVGSGTANIVRDGSTTVEGPYVVADHVSGLMAADRVKVEDVTGEGGYIIAYKLP